MLKWVRNHLGFSKAETYGTIVIFMFMGILIISTPLYEMYLTAHGLPVSTQLLDSVSLGGSIPAPVSDTLFFSDTLFYFDPNTSTPEEFTLLGLPEYLSLRIQKFRNSGMSFRQPKDLYGIYGMDSLWVKRVMPYIKILQGKKDGKGPAKPYKNRQETQNVKIDINKTDTTSLMRIRGIGSVLSKRIIKFRDRLGGFISIQQLSEVYGLSPEVVEKLQESFFVEENFSPVKIDINTSTKENLASHPYFDFKMAELIINFRDQHFPLKSPEDLLQIPKIEPEFLKKISPYLSFAY